MSASVGRRLFQAGGARGIVLLVSLLFTAFSSRLIFQEYGPELFGVVMFFATLQYLIPFADLGLGAVVMNEISMSLENGDLKRGKLVFIRCFKILAIVSFFVIVSFCILAVFAGPQIAIGSSLSTSRYTIIGIAAIIMANVPFSLGNRILIGFDRTHVGIVFSAIGPPMILIFVLVVVHLSLDPALLFIIWPFTNFLINICVFLYALRKIDLSLWSLTSTLKQVPMRQVDDPIFKTAASMSAISIANPLIVGSHRALLLGAGLTGALATYSVAAQIYAPLIGIISSAATPLWTRFSVDSHSDDASRAAAMFPLVGLGAASLLLLGVPGYSMVVTGTWDFVPFSTVALFAILVFIQACILPLSMRFNKGSLLVVQAIIVSMTCIVSITVGFWLTLKLDSAGPLLSTIIALALLQYLPLKIISKKI